MANSPTKGLLVSPGVAVDPLGAFSATFARLGVLGLSPAAFKGGGRIGLGLDYGGPTFGIGVYADTFVSDVLHRNLKLSPALGFRFKF